MKTYEFEAVIRKVPDIDGAYIVGLRKDIRAKIGNQAGNAVKVIIKERM